uniref:Uncharacterized protein n=1 Tax=Romanomermis culicivorax TaxID=13658 RepID=A0A915JC38_ROMCU
METDKIKKETSDKGTSTRGLTESVGNLRFRKNVCPVKGLLYYRCNGNGPRCRRRGEIAPETLPAAKSLARPNPQQGRQNGLRLFFGRGPRSRPKKNVLDVIQDMAKAPQLNEKPLPTHLHYIVCLLFSSFSWAVSSLQICGTSRRSEHYRDR